MSHYFGPVRQNGYVVPDVRAAIEHWAGTLGVGPWHLIEEFPLRDGRYRGRPTDARAAIALGFSGALQIELIEPLDDAPSPYADFLKACPAGGLQHVSSWPTAAEYDAARDRFVAGGGEVLFEGRAGNTRFVYFDTVAHFGTCFEMADLSRGTARLFAAIHDVASTWDGTGPFIRTDWPVASS